MDDASGSGGAAGGERRRAPRVPGTVTFEAEAGPGEGLVKDLSLSGLNVAESSRQPKVGEVIELSFCVGERRIPARAEVTRLHDGGFAAHFTRLDKRLQQLLIVAGPAAKKLAGR